MKKLFPALIAALSLSACFKSVIVSPSPGKFTLAAKEDSCSLLESRKVYQFFGLGSANFNKNTTEPSLENAEKPAKVRFTTEIGFTDYLIAVLTAGIVRSQTITTEICR